MKLAIGKFSFRDATQGDIDTFFDRIFDGSFAGTRGGENLQWDVIKTFFHKEMNENYRKSRLMRTLFFGGSPIEVEGKNFTSS